MIKAILETKQNDSEEGFTLIELMIVVVIIGILAAIAIPIFMNQQKSASYAVLESDVKNVATMITTFKAQKGTLPQTCADWKTLFPGDGWGSNSTAAIAAKVSPDGFNIWVEAQSLATNANTANTTAEIDGMTAVYDSKLGKGVMSRTEYMNETGLTDRARLHTDAGYTNTGLIITSLRTSNPNCQAWGAPTP